MESPAVWLHRFFKQFYTKYICRSVTDSKLRHKTKQQIQNRNFLFQIICLPLNGTYSNGTIYNDIQAGNGRMFLNLRLLCHSNHTFIKDNNGTNGHTYEISTTITRERRDYGQQLFVLNIWHEHHVLFHDVMAILDERERPTFKTGHDSNGDIRYRMRKRPLFHRRNRLFERQRMDAGSLDRYGGCASVCLYTQRTVQTRQAHDP